MQRHTSDTSEMRYGEFFFSLFQFVTATTAIWQYLVTRDMTKGEFSFSLFQFLTATIAIVSSDSWRKSFIFIILFFLHMTFIDISQDIVHKRQHYYYEISWVFPHITRCFHKNIKLRVNPDKPWNVLSFFRNISQKNVPNLLRLYTI